MKDVYQTRLQIDQSALRVQAGLSGTRLVQFIGATGGSRNFSKAGAGS